MSTAKMQTALHRCASSQSPDPAPTAACAAVVCGSKVVWEGAAGHVDEVPATPMTTVMMTASITKTFIAALAMTCVERGELTLDTNIDAYLPFSVRNPHHPQSPITSRHLLLHRSSLHDDESSLEHGSQYRWAASTSNDPVTSSPITLADYIQHRLHQDAAAGDRPVWDVQAKPGDSAYHYSNMGFTLMGRVIELVTGGNLGALANDRLFRPLEMTRTGFFLQHLRAAADSSVQFASPAGQPEGHYEVAEYPAAQLRSTASDLSRWLIFLLSRVCASSGEGKRVLSERSIAMILPSSGVGGLAWWGKGDEYWDGITTFQHGGFMQGVRTVVHLEPKSDEFPRGFGLVVLLNGAGDYRELVECMVEFAKTAGLHHT